MWLSAGATVVRGSSSFVRCFHVFHRSFEVLFGEVKFSADCASFCSVKFEFFGSFGFPWKKRWFLVEL